MQETWLVELKVKSFRHFLSGSFSFSPGLNIIVGPNGAGKTNLLEAVGYLSLARSFRFRSDRDLVRWGDQGFEVMGRIKTKGRYVSVRLSYNPGRKELVLNGSRERIMSLLGLFPTVTFGPHDLDIFFGPPSLRRRFLDRELCQIDRVYAEELLAYQRVLKQRNAALRGLAEGKVSKDALAPWDAELVSLSRPITERRKVFLERLSSFASSFYSSLSPGETLEIVYFPGWPGGEISLERITASLSRELAWGATLWGPHRDDFKIYLNGREARYFASQGEQRSVVLALKLAQVVYFREVLGSDPCVLLDDVFSELDLRRQKELLRLLLGGGQTFITATDTEGLPLEWVGQGQVLTLSKPG